MGAANGARDVFDLDALERDDTAEPFRFTVAGQTFVFSAPGDVDWRFTEALERGSAVALVEALLGEEEYAAFHEIPLPAWKLNKLVEEWGRHNGVELGESAASSASSVTTAARSRPTSGATTASGSRTSQPAG
jgi:hypothetical protein